jgi:hypothetical protein
MKQLYSLAVKVLDEPTASGERKRKYVNIGMVFDSGNGPYMIIDRTFNPAGVPNPDNKTGVVVSMFEPRKNDGRQSFNDEEPVDGLPF